VAVDPQHSGDFIAFAHAQGLELAPLGFLMEQQDILITVI
jgi:hypothetical protein